MKKALMASSVIAIAVTACGPQQGTELRETDTPTVTVTLPPGDIQAGRQAFLDLRCTACHAVPSEPDFPAPVSTNPGPLIDARLADRDVSYLMAAVMTPSHAISTNIGDEVRARLEGTLSPMGDFSRAMTVRQLVDVHAYLRSIK